MHRLFVETALLEQETLALPKEALNHLKVLRPKDGEEIELFDGRGKWRVYGGEKVGGGGQWNLKVCSSILNLQPST